VKPAGYFRPGQFLHIPKLPDSLPVIIVTSSGNIADQKRCFALGATQYFIKPPDLSQFMKLGMLVPDVLKIS
jgi:CheY-like chemotaxis protein